MRVGDVIDGAFTLVRREWRAAVLLGGVNILVFGLYFFWFFAFAFSFDPDEVMPEPASVAAGLALVAGVIVFAIVFVVVTYVLNGMSVRAAVHGPDQGMGWSELFAEAWPAFKAGMRLLGWGLLVGLAISILVVPIAVLIGVLAEDLGALVALLMILLFLGLGLAALALAPVLMVLFALVYGHERSVPAAFGEAWRLVGRAYWPSLGATVILWLFGLVPIVGSLLIAVLTPPYQVSLMDELEAA